MRVDETLFKHRRAAIDKNTKIELSPTALNIAKFRYLDPGETPDDMFQRVAISVANGATKHHWNLSAKEIQDRINNYASDFYLAMKELKFLPNTPCLANAGRELGQLSACFVLPIHDKISGPSSIFQTLEHTAVVHKSGGGTGFSFSRLRPNGSSVTISRGTASGPVSFMRVYDAATAEMKQGGIRRGANMGCLNVTHPDIVNFIMCKDEEGQFENFNISVSLTDEFMNAAISNKNYQTFWKDVQGPTLNANDILNMIATQAWKTGDPGIIFIDTVNKKNPLKDIEIIESTNPCGEQPLPPFGSCTLGSIDVSKFVSKPIWECKDEVLPTIDYEGLVDTIRLGVRFLDCVLEINKYPLKSIAREAKRTRRIGLGIMGFADMLIKLGVVYGSKESLDIVEELMSLFDDTANDESIKLGKLTTIPRCVKKAGLNRRNGCITTIAPTGSLSLIAECSSGMEPVFSFDFDKKCIESSVKVVHPLAQQWLEKNPGKTSLPKYFIEAEDVPMDDHILMQSTFQGFVDASISKTINCRHTTTVSEIRNSIILAWQYGCKSLTFYRDGSKTIQAQVSSKKKQEFESLDQDLQEAFPPSTEIAEIPSSISLPYNPFVEKDRPNTLNGRTFRIKTARGKLYLTVNELDGTPFEIFLNIGKSGAEDAAYSEALGRLTSMALRMGVPVKTIVDHLRDISGDGTAFDLETTIKSVPDAVAKLFMKEYLDENTISFSGLTNRDICPDCGNSSVVAAEGCKVCQVCAWSKC